MDKSFNPENIENSWCKRWQESGAFSPALAKESYCIMLPPPNVTGSLHMGHALQDTLMDILIRYQRMNQKATLWQAGTDHAGIATQMVVERNLNREGVSRFSLGREEFTKKIWEWKQRSGGTINSQLKRLGASLDWSTERFTMDEGMSHAVHTAFVKLYREGLIYRGERLVNWDPILKTAISDLEVVTEETCGKLWHIRYPLVDSNDYCIIATTRPETMLGDVAVAVHPDDARYTKLIGKKIALPLSDREIPIIADSYVEPEFGTGCVKITPAHDHADYAIGTRHNLECINILNSDASIAIDGPYKNLDCMVARDKIVADLDKLGLIVKIESHSLKVPKSDRTGAVVQPYLTKQWFVKTKPLAEPAIQAVVEGDIKFTPANWEKTYFDWMHKIEDWCISRQLWWGHRIPAWYDDDGNIYVAHTEAEARAHYKLSEQTILTQDEDVLDTWFSSALWPFATLGWPDDTERLDKFYPTDVLVTGFDIIFFWVARMIMFGLKFTGKIPFKEVYIHGLIQDENGKKMSKSKGNVLDPLDLIDGISFDDLLAKRTQGLMQPDMAKSVAKATLNDFPEGINAHGTDALRFTLCSLATTGRHIRFELKRLAGYKNFCNKLWNAARYVLMQAENNPPAETADCANLTTCDKWALSVWQTTKAKVKSNLENYRFDLVAKELYEYTWNNYCDWYLELTKPVLSGDIADKVTQAASMRNLIVILDELLRMLHPIIPFITEEIWAKLKVYLPQDKNMLIEHSIPEVGTTYPVIETEVNWLQRFITSIRTIRAEMNLAPSKHVPVLLDLGNELEISYVKNNASLLSHIAKITQLEFHEGAKPTAVSTSIVGDMQVMVPLKDLIDKDKELQRLEKEIAKITKNMAKTEAKLANQSYIVKAPKSVVVKEQDKLRELKAAYSSLQTSLEQIQQI